MINEKIIKNFEKLIEFYKISLLKNTSNKYRVLSYSKALKSIKKYKKEIKSGEQIEHLDGVGESVVKKVDEILKTGTLKILKKKKTGSELINIFGIGPTLANKLIKKNIKTLSQLRKSKELKALPKMAQIGVKYHKQLSTPIPRKKVLKIAKDIHNILSKQVYYVRIGHEWNKHICKYKVIKAGSYLDKNKKFLNDIDIIITYKDHKTNKLQEILKLLLENKILKEVISSGKNKAMAITTDIHHIDVHIVENKHLDYYLMYFSGGAEKNRKMRQRAKQLGYKLNEYGLWKNGKKMNISVKEVKKLLL